MIVCPRRTDFVAAAVGAPSMSKRRPAVDVKPDHPQNAPVRRAMSVQIIPSVEAIDIDAWADSYVRAIARATESSTSRAA